MWNQIHRANSPIENETRTMKIYWSLKKAAKFDETCSTNTFFNYADGLKAGWVKLISSLSVFFPDESVKPFRMKYIPFSRFVCDSCCQRVVYLIDGIKRKSQSSRMERKEKYRKKPSPKCKIPFYHSSKTRKAWNSRNWTERVKHEAQKNQQSTVRNLCYREVRGKKT